MRDYDRLTPKERRELLDRAEQLRAAKLISNDDYERTRLSLLRCPATAEQSTPDAAGVSSKIDEAGKREGLACLKQFPIVPPPPARETPKLTDSGNAALFAYFMGRLPYWGAKEAAGMIQEAVEEGKLTAEQGRYLFDQHRAKAKAKP